MLLDGRSENLAHRRGAAVDEDDQRQIELSPPVRRVHAVVAATIDLLVDGASARQKVTQKPCADINAPARVAAQIEDQPVYALVLKRGDVLLDRIDHRGLG